MYICVVCNKEFRGRQKSKANKYCSKDCQYFGFKKRVDKTCLICGKSFNIPHSRRDTAQYCSFVCANKGLENKKQYICLNCGKEFTHWAGRKRTYCKPECRYNHWRGEGSPTWLGGLSFGDYSIEFNSELKKKVRERDKNLCQMCGVPERECLVSHSVHHIDYNKKNSNEKNLIILCNLCHLKTNINRDKWQVLLSRKQEENMGSTQIQQPSPPPAPLILAA